MATTYGSHATETPEGMLCPIDFPVLARLDEWVEGGRRRIGSGGFTVRDLPQSVLVQRVLADGHEGAVASGMVDEVTVDDDGVVSGKGWLLDDGFGQDAARLVMTKVLPGNSVNLAVSDMDLSMDDKGNMVMDVTESAFAGTTLVSIPAFEGAFAQIPDGVKMPVASDAMMASIGEFSSQGVQTFSAATATLARPSAALFADPQLTEPTPLVVTEDGRVYGHLATWGTRHLNVAGARITPPKSRSGYAYFATGHVLTDAGMVPTGRLVIGGEHADKGLGWRQALDHYASTSCAWADVAVGEDSIGIWFAGMVRPGTADETVYAARASGLSGDWRQVGGPLDLVAALSVNAPGFPIPRPHAYSFGGEQRSLIGAGALAARQPEVAPMPATMTRFINSLAKGEADKIAAELRAEEAQAIVASMDFGAKVKSYTKTVNGKEVTVRSYTRGGDGPSDPYGTYDLTDVPLVPENVANAVNQIHNGINTAIGDLLGGVADAVGDLAELDHPDQTIPVLGSLRDGLLLAAKDTASAIDGTIGALRGRTDAGDAVRRAQEGIRAAAQRG